MRERRRDYELLFIISPLRSSEEDLTNSINRVRQAITAAGGEITSLDQTAPWGRRKFAYPIREYAEGEASRRSFTEGYYVLCHFSLATGQLGPVERSLKLNDAVLRYMLTLAVASTKSARPVSAVSVGGEADDEELDEAGEDDDEE